MFVCTTRAQLILEQHKKQKREKERNKKRNKISLMFFPPPSPKKRKKCGHRKCRPKGTQVTKGRRTRTDKSLISLLSLSLFRVAYASIHSSSSRKKRRHRITRPKKARRILPPSRFSRYLRSRDGGVVSSERESTQKKASIRPRKKNKQTNKGETKNLKKCQRGIFQRAKRGRLLGDWRRLFTKNLREEENTKRLLLTR